MVIAVAVAAQDMTDDQKKGSGMKTRAREALLRLARVLCVL